MSSTRLFLAGDLMTARGIDRILPHPGDPLLHEAYARYADDYVELAERRNGPIPRPADFAYVWGVALGELERRRPEVRLVNLETAVTARGWPVPKGINYRMNPANLPVLAAAGIDCCVLANNHVLDWGEEGLLDTLQSLDAGGLHHAGAGTDGQKAEAPAILPLADGGRLLVFAFAGPDCGVPSHWAAGEQLPGVARLEDLSAETLQRVAQRIRAARRPDDRVVVALHWGGNWGFTVPAEQQRFAHALIDEAGVDLLHGHSSHHVKGIEVYRQRLILYGCGDLLDDYEGIDDHDLWRGDLGFLYFAELDADGRLQALELVPTRQWRFSLHYAEGKDRQWLQDTLNRESARFGCHLRDGRGRALRLDWPEAA
ncbi:CapA family protein [Azotobacter chroococcum]|uniref:CapA family protein n=1 Tax=Azotobacter chroococcum TaxID=353 RepID=A0AA43ZBL3_9GAMM|nr:CapA family protein [Azotobacter chroococcum]NHN79756.1 CapA family protein [Azotobacter chroococcum]